MGSISGSGSIREEKVTGLLYTYKDLALSFRYVFTVFTPTYNRAQTLGRVYESLQKQTFRDFEWLVVDDGSGDNTFELIQDWQKKSDFSIRYFRQDNQGKHFAYNRGVTEALGKLFLLIDSDDSFVPEALEKFLYYWEMIPSEERNHFVGVTALCMDQNGKMIGTGFPRHITDSNVLEIHYKYKVKGEKWGFNRTAVLKNYLFPEILKKEYFPEGIIWNAIARVYQTRFVNERLRVYWIEKNSLVHGKHIAKKNALGGHLEHLHLLNDNLTWFRFAPLEFFRSALHYGRFSFHAGISPRQQLRLLKTRWSRCLWVLMFPLALLMVWKDKMG